MKREEELTVMDASQAKEISTVIERFLSPVLSAMAKMVSNNTEALERIAAQQKMQSDRMEALEKQIRLNTPVTPVQVRYINGKIRERAEELLAEKARDGFAPQEDKKRVNRLGGAIRRDVLTRYGVCALHEIPRHEYAVVISMVEMWNNLMVVRKAAREN